MPSTTSLRVPPKRRATAFSRSTGYCWVAKRRARVIFELSTDRGACIGITRLSPSVLRARARRKRARPTSRLVPACSRSPSSRACSAGSLLRFAALGRWAREEHRRVAIGLVLGERAGEQARAGEAVDEGVVHLHVDREATALRAPR